MHRTIIAFLGILLALLATACGSSAPPNCETAVREAVHRFSDGSVADEDVADLVGQCITERWTAIDRTCVAKATTEVELASCLARGAPAAHRRSEAELNLDAIAKSARTTFVEKAEFPIASVGLTPARSCCEYPNKKCPAVASDWTGVPAWDQLDFDISEDHYYQYAYTSDGKTYEARAVGDLDCDGTRVTYVLRGRVVDGQPVSELVAPAGAD